MPERVALKESIGRAESASDIQLTECDRQRQGNKCDQQPAFVKSAAVKPARKRDAIGDGECDHGQNVERQDLAR